MKTGDNMRYMEIMAPAGGREQMIAAIRAGADSVYLGAGGFNARQNAENFGGNALADAVDYCHARGTKVYVTLNTLIMDQELAKLEKEADLVAASGADAVIVQDMAVLRLLRQKYPTIRRYASTQTAVHNVDGAKQLEELGFDSVVLARELELAEMEKIASSVSIKCEAFVHGAHCMSVSGACYLSAMLGGRSGNRGLCAQPCRTNSRCSGHTYALSLKDMSLVSHMREMSEAGVNSFKIEGRMKRPEYVACAVSCCLLSREGKPYDEDTLRRAFSRSGFTDGYLTGKRDHTMFGHRTQDDADETDAVLGSLRELYRVEKKRVPFSAELTLSSAAPARLTLSCDGKSICAEGPAAETPRTRPSTPEDAERAVGKTGGTPFYLERMAFYNPDGLALPAPALGEMRRRALDELLLSRTTHTPHAAHNAPRAPYAAHAHPASPRLYGKFASPNQVPDAAFDRVILPLSAIREDTIARYGTRLVAELPPILFPRDEEAAEQVLDRAIGMGLTAAYTENLYGTRLAKEKGLYLIGGPCLNIMNSEALREFRRMELDEATVSFELTLAAAQNLEGSLPRGIMAYGRFPLMRMRACPARDDQGCGACDGHPVLTDRKNVEFPIACAARQYSTLLNSVPVDISGRELAGLDFILLSFTTEEKEECARITGAFQNSDRPEEAHTTGLYFKQVQ